MKKNAKAFLVSVGICGSAWITANTQTCSRPSLLLIDTDGHNQYQYRNLILLAESVGFSVEYRNFYSFLEHTDVSPYAAIFFMPSIGLFKNLHSNLTQKCIKAIKQYALKGNKILGLLFPGMPSVNVQLEQLSFGLMDQLGVFSSLSQEHSLLIKQLTHETLSPDSQAGNIYGTTLVNKVYTHHTKKNASNPINSAQEILITGLPLTEPVSTNVLNLLPWGVYIKNTNNNNRYFISKVSNFTFADLAENFFKNPLNLNDRNELLHVAQQTLWELYQAVINNHMSFLPKKNALQLPKQLTLNHIEKEKQLHQTKTLYAIENNPDYAWIVQDGVSCAWEAPGDYFLYEDAEMAKMDPKAAHELTVKALDQGISFLYDAHINLVWFEFNPEAYLSDHGRFKHNKETFIKQVNAIAIDLKKKAQKLKKPLPKVFIGTDITTNFATHPVKNQAQDVFGHTYSKIPSPLDFEHFWKPEVLEPFTLFCKHFQHHLPITGVFLDFEMYHAPEQASAYSDHMDFSHNTWQRCCQSIGDGSSCGLSTVAQRVEYLLNNQLFEPYFIHLENAAETLGKTIKKELQLLIPHLLIAAYLPTLPSSWFYRGIMRGLSSKEHPVITATFNTDFSSHAQWLSENNIHIIHGPPILLSKFTDSKSFDLIKQFLRYHDFVWYNRPSRMVYPDKKNKWWSVEASDLKASEIAYGIKAKTPVQKRALLKPICQ
jgi:hypothetical protein